MSLDADGIRALHEHLRAVLENLAQLRTVLDRRKDCQLRMLQQDVSDWAEHRWPGTDALSKGRKLVHEAGEFAEAAGRHQVAEASELTSPLAYLADLEATKLHMVEEAADTQLVLVHVWRMLGVEGPTEIAAVCRAVWEAKSEVATR